MDSASPSTLLARAGQAFAPSPRMRQAVTVVLLWLAAFVLYLPSADYAYVYHDDVRILADHPELYNQPHFIDGLKAIMWEQFPREEPLLIRDLSWAIDSRLFGFASPHGFHFVNVVLHACNVALLFVFLLTLTRRYALALLATVCFLSLAIHVEPVAWVMGRKDLLAAAFGFLALLAHSRGVDAAARTRKAGWHAGSLVFVTLALLSKISAVVLPGVLFLLAVFQPALRDPAAARGAFPWKRIPSALLGVTPHLVISLIVGRWYYATLAQYGILNRGYTASAMQHIGNLLLIDPMVLVRYLQLLVMPADLSLFYTWPSLALPFTTMQILWSGAVILLVAASAVLLLARRRDLAFYWLSFLVLMVPFLNLTFIGIWVANRYLYFPSFCLLAGLAAVALDGVRRRPRVLGPLLLALVLAFCTYNGWRQRQYLAVWRDSETLWTYELRRPDAPVEAFYSLAAYYYTTAGQQDAPAERENRLRKAEAVIARARATYTTASGKPHPQLHGIAFIDALITIVRNRPANEQLAALQEVEQLNPTYDAVLWQLVLFHCKEALQAADATVREGQARLALAYYARYLAAEYRDAGSPSRDRAMRRDLETNFPFLKTEIERLP
jgi:hypothetical protein